MTMRTGKLLTDVPARVQRLTLNVKMTGQKSRMFKLSQMNVAQQIRTRANRQNLIRRKFVPAMRTHDPFTKKNRLRFHIKNSITGVILT